MAKVCFRCGVEKEIEEYYKHDKMADGHFNKCKECAKQDERNRRILNPERLMEYEYKRNRSTKRKKQLSEYQAKWRQKNRDKYVAHYTVKNAIRDGRLIKKEECEICGACNNIEGHHYDYKYPLDVIWLCIECHRHLTVCTNTA